MSGMQGVNRLARVLDSRMKKTSPSSVTAELGDIQGDLSLKLDGFGVAIPKDDYLVCRGVTQVAPLKAGDRVLAIWVNGSKDVVIQDVVVSN